MSGLGLRAGGESWYRASSISAASGTTLSGRITPSKQEEVVASSPKVVHGGNSTSKDDVRESGNSGNGNGVMIAPAMRHFEEFGGEMSGMDDEESESSDNSDRDDRSMVGSFLASPVDDDEEAERRLEYGTPREEEEWTQLNSNLKVSELTPKLSPTVSHSSPAGRRTPNLNRSSWLAPPPEGMAGSKMLPSPSPSTKQPEPIQVTPAIDNPDEELFPTLKSWLGESENLLVMWEERVIYLEAETAKVGTEQAVFERLFDTAKDVVSTSATRHGYGAPPPSCASSMVSLPVSVSSTSMPASEKSSGKSSSGACSSSQLVWPNVRRVSYSEQSNADPKNEIQVQNEVRGQVRAWLEDIRGGQSKATHHTDSLYGGNIESSCCDKDGREDIRGRGEMTMSVYSHCGGICLIPQATRSGPPRA